MYLLAPVSPVWCSKYLYQKAFGRPLDLDNPVTLNEKLMWLKLNVYGDDDLVTRCADKYAVREYVEAAGCGEILNDLYGVWETPEQIDWEQLPEKFILKCNHGCGYNSICTDKAKMDTADCKKKLKKWLSRDFWRFASELQYRKIPKRIICEKLLCEGSAPVDYKFYCFHGEPVCVLACCEREKGWPKFYFFDCDWNFMPITKDGKKEAEDFTLPKPTQFSRMVEYARKLSRPFPFVRVDLYEAEEEVVFGELTFTPGACLDSARLPETDLMFGKMLRIDKI